MGATSADGGNDPRLVFKVTGTGRYLLTILDSQLLGGPDFVYRLTIGTLPAVTSYLPRGEKPGRAVDLLLHGLNLGGSTRGITAIPADTPQGEMWTTVQTARGPALPFPLLVDMNPVIGLTETDAAMPLPTLPCSLDAAFQVYPRLRFLFEASPSDHLVFDLFGRRIGSRIDGALRVLDQNGKEIASAHDTPGLGRDARLEFTPPGAALYTIELRNVAEKLGPDCFYRLAARRAGPDFRLTMDMDRIQVPTAGSVSVPVTIERLFGFDGAVTLVADGLPAGVTCGGATIGAGRDRGELTISAAADAPFAAAAIRIRGSAEFGGRSVTREAQPRERYVPRSPSSGAQFAYGDCELLPLAVVAPSSRKEPAAQP